MQETLFDLIERADKVLVNGYEITDFDLVDSMGRPTDYGVDGNFMRLQGEGENWYFHNQHTELDHGQADTKDSAGNECTFEFWMTVEMKPLRDRETPHRGLQTNEELVVDLMNFSPYGALTQAFVMEAIQSYAERVAHPDTVIKDTSFMHGATWKAVGIDIKARLEAFFNRHNTPTEA